MSEKGPEPVITSEEIERIIKELEKKEEEQRKKRELQEKHAHIETPPFKPQPQGVSPPKPPPAPPVSPESNKPKWLSFIFYPFLFIVLFILIYVGLNLPFYRSRLGYFYKFEVKKESPPAFNLPSIENQPIQEINLSDRIIIPKIQVEAPIIWEVEWENILQELKNGVVHFKGTALPNEEGTVVLTGHSSTYPWARGSYDKVFTLLDKLNLSDQIIIIYQKRKYTYVVSNKKIIKPSEVRVISREGEYNLSLITCWPIGTSLKRLVVEAKLVEKPSTRPSEPTIPSVF